MNHDLFWPRVHSALKPIYEIAKKSPRHQTHININQIGHLVNICKYVLADSDFLLKPARCSWLL